MAEPADAELVRCLSERRVRFLCGFRQPVPGYCPMHAHAGLEIVYHPRGAGRTSILGGVGVEFAQGDVVVYPPALQHDQSMRQPGEDFCVQLEMRAPVPQVLAGFLHIREVEDPWAVGELHALTREHAGPGDAERLALDLRASALLAHLVAAHRSGSRRGRTRADALAEEAHRRIKERYHDIDSVDDVARSLGVGPDHLRHVFKSRWGMSPVRWLGDVRIERAKDLLAHSAMPIKDIARSCAFRDEHYFRAAFRKATGQPPGRFRKGR